MPISFVWALVLQQLLVWSFLIKCGAQREKIYMLDTKGVIHTRRDDLNEYKKLFANNTDKRTLEEAIDGADVFVGVSGPNVLIT